MAYASHCLCGYIVQNAKSEFPKENSAALYIQID
jgi:hypothetical protein